MCTRKRLPLRLRSNRLHPLPRPSTENRYQEVCQHLETGGAVTKVAHDPRTAPQQIRSFGCPASLSSHVSRLVAVGEEIMAAVSQRDGRCSAKWGRRRSALAPTSFHVTISLPRSIKKYARPAFRPALRPTYAR